MISAFEYKIFGSHDYYYNISHPYGSQTIGYKTQGRRKMDPQKKNPFPVQESEEVGWTV